MSRPTPKTRRNRPVTMVCCQNDYTRDITTRTMDVVCINRYYGWYNLSGDLENAAYAFQQELDFWAGIDKPLWALSEYGADTVAGLHGTAPRNVHRGISGGILQNHQRLP